jgi:hypothetical protein
MPFGCPLKLSIAPGGYCGRRGGTGGSRYEGHAGQPGLGGSATPRPPCHGLQECPRDCLQCGKGPECHFPPSLSAKVPWWDFVCYPSLSELFTVPSPLTESPSDTLGIGVPGPVTERSPAPAMQLLRFGERSPGGISPQCPVRANHPSNSPKRAGDFQSHFGESNRPKARICIRVAPIDWRGIP